MRSTGPRAVGCDVVQSLSAAAVYGLSLIGIVTPFVPILVPQRCSCSACSSTSRPLCGQTDDAVTVISLPHVSDAIQRCDPFSHNLSYAPCISLHCLPTGCKSCTATPSHCATGGGLAKNQRVS
jgi:hypothetical protein